MHIVYKGLNRLAYMHELKLTWTCHGYISHTCGYLVLCICVDVAAVLLLCIYDATNSIIVRWFSLKWKETMSFTPFLFHLCVCLCTYQSNFNTINPNDSNILLELECSWYWRHLSMPCWCKVALAVRKKNWATLSLIIIEMSVWDKIKLKNSNLQRAFVAIQAIVSHL